MSTDKNDTLAAQGSYASLVGLVLTLAQTAVLGIYQPDVVDMDWKERLQVVLALGLIAGILYGFLWSVVAQKIILGSDYGEETSMPTGWAAVLLSLSLTLPITCLPPLYQLWSGRPILSGSHYLYAATLANGASIIGHLIWYGIKSLHFAGIREIVFPFGAGVNVKRYALMEMLVTCMHVFSTVAVFRAFAQNQASIFGPSAVLMPTLTSAMFFFTGICFYSFIKYPQSLEKGGWAQVRGVLAGMLLCIGLTGGMLM